MIVRMDDYPSGVRPIFADQMAIFDKMLEVFEMNGIPVHLGIVPLTFKKYGKTISKFKNVIPCQHGYHHRYSEYSETLINKDDVFNSKTFGNFDEFVGQMDDHVLEMIRDGKNIIESHFKKPVTHYIPVCNVIDNRLAKVLESQGFTTILSDHDNQLDTNLKVIKSDFYGKLENFDFSKMCEVVTLHITWEWDTIRARGFDWWEVRVEQFAAYYHMIQDNKTQAKTEPYKILFKFPIRYRREKFFSTLNKYYQMIRDQENFKFLITVDKDDTELNNSKTLKMISKYKNCEVQVSECTNKIQAVNYGIFGQDFDIVVIVSDDMIPQVDGFDNIIREKMQEHYPDLDGCLWFNDGFQTNEINTLQICGRKWFDRFGYVYHEDYVSQRCDVEYQKMAIKAGKITYFSECIIKHEHPDWGLAPYDKLLIHNYTQIKRDESVYYEREKLGFPVKIPKIAHFIWSNGTNVSYFRYLTIKTFKDLHPDWKIYLWLVTEIENKKTWGGTEKLEFCTGDLGNDYIDEMDQLADEVNYRKMPGMAPNYAGDLLRWQVLYEFGGFYFDMDQIFLKSFNDFVNYDIVFGGDKIIYSGVVGMFKHCPIAKEMAKLAEAAIKTAKNYCDAGNWLWLDYVIANRAKLNFYQTKQTEQSAFYPIPESHMMKPFYQGLKEFINLDNIYACHWFGGHPDSQEANKKSKDEIDNMLKIWFKWNI